MRAMKDSGIEWIGEIPKDWTVRRLRYMCNIVTGNQDTQDNDPDGQYPFYVRSPIVEKSNKYTFEGPAILMSGDGAGAGRIFHMVDGKYGCHQRVYSIQDISGIDRKVLYHYMSNLFWIMIETANSKSTVDSVRLNMLQDFPVLVPSEEEQKKLSRCLSDTVSRIDNIISKTRASIDEYKKLKQAIITQAVTKGVRGDRKMKDSGIEWIGEIPLDWKIAALKNFCTMQAGKTLSSEQIAQEGQYPVYGGNGIRGFYNEFNNNGKYLLIGRQGALCGNVHKVEGKFWATEHAVLVKVFDHFDCDFLYYLLIGMNLNQYASNTAAQPGLAVSTILNLKTCMVPYDEQQKVAKYLDEKCAMMDNLIIKKEQYLLEIENYKKSLIYEYVTGKKEVPQKYQI